MLLLMLNFEFFNLCATTTTKKVERQIVFDHLINIASGISVDTDLYLLMCGIHLGISRLGVLWRAWLWECWSVWLCYTAVWGVVKAKLKKAFRKPVRGRAQRPSEYCLPLWGVWDKGKNEIGKQILERKNMFHVKDACDLERDTKSFKRAVCFVQMDMVLAYGESCATCLLGHWVLLLALCLLRSSLYSQFLFHQSRYISPE